jgi:hypothetical protein
MSNTATRTVLTIGTLLLWLGQANARPVESLSALKECARAGKRIHVLTTAGDELTGSLVEVTASPIVATVQGSGREFVLVALGALPAAGSQTPDPPLVASVTEGQVDNRFHIGIGGLFGVPFGTLREAVGLTGGIGYEFAYRLPSVPILLGFDGELWQHSTDASALNSVLAGHLLVRFQRATGTMRPYADSIIGLDYIATHTQGVDRAALETRALGLGIGAGVTRTLSASNHVSLDLRARYRRASAADFLSSDLVRTRTRTRMFTVYAGFAVDL